MSKIKIIKDQASTNARVEGIDIKPLPLNSYTCGITVETGGITIFNPSAPNEEGVPTKVMDRVPYTNFVKSNGSDPVSAEDLKADIDLQLSQPGRSDEALYRGLWNADTNTPDLTTLDPSAEVGDFFKISQNGNYNGIDYEINDEIIYNGTSWDRLPAPEPWEYVDADDSYDITVLNNKTFVDYVLTSNKDITLPTLSPADAGWMCTIVNSSQFKLKVFGTSSGNRKLNEGGSLQLLFNGNNYIALSFTSSSNVLSGYNVKLISNRDSNIYADGKQGKLDNNGISGWNFQNDFQGDKINWYYIYNQNENNEMTLETLTSMYAVVKIYNEKEFFFNIYTKRQNDGNDFSWYRSRVNYESTTAFNGLAGETVLVYWGKEPTSHPELQRVELPYEPTFSNGNQDLDEEILFASLSTDSSASAGEYNFTVQALGYTNDREETSYLTKITEDFDLIKSDISTLKLFKEAVQLARFFRGYVFDETSMDNLLNPIRYQYVARVDTGTIWEYDGTDWYNTLISISLEGISQKEELILSYTDRGYIELDGLNDYINLINVPVEVMDYTEQWNLGIDLVANIDTVNDASYITLFKRGNNEITLRKGGSNWGLYVYSNGVSVGQANTWYAPSPGSKILIVCTGSRIKYYLNGVLRANVLINANVSQQNPTGDLEIGNGGIKGNNWTGGVDNILIMQGSNAIFGKDQLLEYNNQSNVSNMSFYPSVIDFIPLGERPYPNVLGLKQIVEGTIENSTESSFIIKNPEGSIGTPFAQATGRYVFLDGSDNYIEFDNADARILDYNESWAFSMSLKSVSGVNDNQPTILFSRGKNEIRLVKGGSNWGFYCYADGLSVGQANTWYAPTSESTIVVICNGSTIQYYLNGVRRANISINANVSNQDPSGNLKMGSPYSGAVQNWYGGVENSFLISGANALLSSAEVNEFIIGVLPTSLSYYNNLDDFFQYGLETYPSIDGVKEVITGNLINGTEEDFVNI